MKSQELFEKIKVGDMVVINDFYAGKFGGLEVMPGGLFVRLDERRKAGKLDEQYRDRDCDETVYVNVNVIETLTVVS